MNDKQISDTWKQGGPYEQYVGRWSRKIAPKFLTWLHCATGLRWLDVGCGTGALSGAVVDNCSPMLVAGMEPSNGFLKVAKEKLADRVVLYQGTATHIPLAASTVDVIVSGLVLNFVIDQHAAILEMARVSSSGGIIGAYVWDYAEKMEMMRHFWDAVVALHPNDAAIDEGDRFPLCNPEALMKLFADAGLREIDVTAIDIQTNFRSFEDYWQPFLGGQGSAPSYVMALDGNERARLREHLRARVPMQADGSISLVARAWAVRATVEK